MRKITVVVGSRANYSSIKSAMRAIQARSDLQLQVVVCASALLDRYGSVVNLIEKDGFKPAARVHMLVEGETPTTMAKSTGLGLLELPTVFEQLKPDIVLTVGDRFETMATTLAAAYMNIPLAHTMGGEISGTIDESIRHAVTKFAHIHFPACSEAAERIIRMGERPETVHMVGCPRIDLVAEIQKQSIDVLSAELFHEGVGEKFNLEEPFVIVSQHPVTTEYGKGEQHITETLSAVSQCGYPAIILWPNADAGSEHVAQGIRKFREHQNASKMHFFKHIPFETYIKLMTKTSCIVGNSSAAIREGAFLGLPAVNIGTRQQGRQRGSNVIDVGYSQDEITAAIQAQIRNRRRASEPIYGDGRAGIQISEILATSNPVIQKKINY